MAGYRWRSGRDNRGRNCAGPHPQPKASAMNSRRWFQISHDFGDRNIEIWAGEDARLDGCFNAMREKSPEIWESLFSAASEKDLSRFRESMLRMHDWAVANGYGDVARKYWAVPLGLDRPDTEPPRPPHS